MRILVWLATVVPAFVAGISVGHVVGSLDAPAPFPFLAAGAVALIALHVLDSLVDTLLAHRAATRG